MQMRDGPSCTRTAIALHWLVAVAVVGQFAWGWWMLDIPKQPVGPRVDAFNLHKSIGLTILALMVARAIWRLTHPAPGLPQLPAWQARVAHANHALLYVALFVLPVAGYLGSVWSGYPVKFFGMTLPAWGTKSVALKDACSTLHYAAGWVLAGAVALHVAGALSHLSRRHGGVLSRMGLPLG